MDHLLTADIHLDDQPGNEYRWEVFRKILETCQQKSISSVVIAGDLSDKKDRHTGKMVNRLVRNLTNLTRFGIKIRILRGNHDLPLDGAAYWTFLGSIPGVTFFDEPYYDNQRQILYLPYTAHPEEDWVKVEKELVSNPKIVFLHQLIDGAVVNNRQMTGVSIPKFIQKAEKVWAGDIHDPQTIGAVEYIGAPHPVSFGDSHKCRFVIVGDDYKQKEEIILTPPAKKIITIRSFLDLRNANVRAGDQARIRVELDAAQISEWGALQDRVASWAARKGINLVSTEAIFRIDEKTADDEKDITSWTNPNAVLEAYLTENNITGDLKDMGIALLKKAFLLDFTSHAPETRVGVLSFRIDSIKIENFCSFLEAQTVDFPKSSGLRLLAGINEVEPDLGANGAGKSSLWESISFCLYGKASDGDRGAALVSTGAKRSRVSIVLDLNGTKYEITRLSNPNYITLNGKVASQESIHSLIRLTDEQFYQSVFFGQGRPLFYDMGIAARDEFLNDILSLEIWEYASNATTTQLKSIDKEIVELERNLSFITGNLKQVTEVREKELQEMIERHHQKNMEKIKELKKEIETNETEKEKREKQITELLSSVKKLSANSKERPSQNKITEISMEIKSIETKKDLILEELAFYQDHEDCPVCRQNITLEFRNAKIQELKKDETNFSNSINTLRKKLASEKEIYNALVEEWDATTRAIHEINAKIALIRQQINYIDIAIKKLEKEIDYLNKEENPYKRQLDTLYKERIRFNAELKDIEKKRAYLRGQRTLTQFWVEGFKKVRLFIASQILGVLTLETKTALGLLGLPNWEVEFRQEKDTKSGTVKPGIHIIVTEKESSRERWSGGEQQRLRLSVSLAISNLIQRMNAVRVQIEIWDEPASYLSGKGTENLFDILAYRAETLHKTIWVVDHNNLEHPSILETWLVRKTKEFGSKVEILTQSTGE